MREGGDHPKLIACSPHNHTTWNNGGEVLVDVACAACSAGSVTNILTDPSASLCVACEVGQFTASSSQSLCALCRAGSLRRNFVHGMRCQDFLRRRGHSVL